MPAVSVRLPETLPLTVEFLINKWAEFIGNDDVFAREFTTGGLLLLQTDVHRSDIRAAIADVQSHLERVSTTLVLLDDTIDKVLPEGPYVVVGTELHQAWRLYEDSLEAFVSSTVPALGQQYGYMKGPPPQTKSSG